MSKLNSTVNSKASTEVIRNKIASARQPRIRVIENFILIWLNSQSNEFDDNTQNSVNQLRQIVNTIKIFNDSDQCMDYLSQVKDEKLFLIISNSFDHQIISFAEKLSSLYSIYLLTNNKFDYQQFKKIKGTYNNIELIYNELKNELHQYQNDLTPITIVTSTDLNEHDQSFMYSQLIKELLLDMDYDSNAKNELIEFCRHQYAGNQYELEIINEFERDYDQSSPIWWYTRDCFTYLMLNKALRTQDTEVIIKMGFFIRDLHRQIEKIYSNIDRSQSLTVYRSQSMLNSDFEKLIKSKGGLLSFNNFLSATTDREIWSKRSVANPNLTSILFQMEISPLSPFASLDKISFDTNSEKEILFSMHSIFRIGEIKQIEDRVWQVNLTLTSDNDEQLERLTEYIRKAARGETGMHRMGKLMLVMGKMDKAKEIYSALLQTTEENDQKELAYLQHQLGYINEQKDDLVDALSHYEQSLDIYLSYLPLSDPQLCPAYSNIGLILKKQGNLDGALECLQHALDIDLIASNPDHLAMAIRYNNIGGVFDAQGKCTDALENYQHALEIEQIYLPPHHPLIGATHNSIGLVYYSMKDYPTALTHFSKTLEIEQKSLSTDHPSLVMTHANIAGALEDLHRYKEAIEHTEKAINIVRNAFGSDHPQVLMFQDYLNQLREKQ